MNYTHEIEHDTCDDMAVEKLEIGQVECGHGCVKLSQASDVIELTPRMIDELINALREVRELSAC